jgi:hypothetical protein
MAVVQLQDKRFRESYQLLKQLDPEALGQRSYLYYATLSDYYLTQEDYPNALTHMDTALDLVTNQQEKKYLEKKRISLIL